jgi:hypothetical protein
MVWNGTSFATAWVPNWTGLKFSELKPDGTLVQDLTVYQRAGPYVSRPSLAWSGSQYGLAFDDYYEGTLFLRLDQNGDAIAEPLVVSSDSTEAPSLVWADNSYAIVWPDHRDGNGELYFTRIDQGGQRSQGDVRLTSTEGESTSPCLAWNGTSFGLLWMEQRSAAADLYFASSIVKEIVLVRSEYSLRRIPISGGAYRISIGRGLNTALRGLATEQPHKPFRSCASMRLVRRSDQSFDLIQPVDKIAGVTAWNGVDSGVFFQDTRLGFGEIFFVRWGSNCIDSDGDGVASSDDCDDADNRIYPGANEACDGIANDCRRVVWPVVPAIEADGDADSWRVCAGTAMTPRPRCIHRRPSRAME